MRLNSCTKEYDLMAHPLCLAWCQKASGVCSEPGSLTDEGVEDLGCSFAFAYMVAQINKGEMVSNNEGLERAEPHVSSIVWYQQDP